ncbi:tyrosine-type recombinase/integrase [Tahibacter sp.]|uniref:site-specific integrase n=1 Tax=Tahibacter sp. TaxID=2056211 RepID=UPI0028C5050F|nr:tyrosine-type recombinase/integrase [Tahibacter sp.]
MSTSVHLDLTPSLLESLRFDTRLDERGKVAGPTPPGTREWVVRDLGVRGLLLRLTPRTTTWYVQKKVGGAPMRRAMGHWWSANEGYRRLSLTEARKRAKIWLGLMEQGVDPLVEKKKRQRAAQSERERDGLTLKVAFDDYVEARSRKAKASTTTDRKKVPKWMAGAPLWAMPVHDIDEAAVEATMGPLLRAVADGTKRPAWGPKSLSGGTVAKLFAYCSAAYARASPKVGLPSGRGVGPFATWRADQRWPQPVRRETYLATATDAGQSWLKQLVDLRAQAHDPDILRQRPDPRSREVKPHASVLLDFFVCVLLWGSRKEETARLKWDDVDLERNLVVFPASITKSGKAGVVPLTPWAKEVLVERRTANSAWRPDDEACWVFPSRQRGKPLNNPRSVLLALQKHTGLWITAHDLRRTLATELGQVQVSAENLGRLLIVGAALNHSRGATGATPSNATSGYIQEQAEVLRPSYQAREDRLRSLVGLPTLEPMTTTARKESVNLDLEAVLRRIESDDGAVEQLLGALLRRRAKLA